MCHDKKVFMNEILPILKMNVHIDYSLPSRKVFRLRKMLLGADFTAKMATVRARITESLNFNSVAKMLGS